MKKLSSLLVMFAAVFMLTGCGMEVVEEGGRGIYTRWGKVEGEPLQPGLHFYNPVSGNIFEMTVREEKREANTSAFTIDTQNVTIAYAVTFYPDPTKIGHLYSQFGRQWEQKIVDQAVLGTIKDVVGQYRADDLVGKREQATKAIETALRTSLASRDVTVTRVDITNLDFQDAYERAVEEKVTAIQTAIAEKNRTQKVMEEAKQTVERAKADAEAMRIKTAALTQNKSLIEYEYAQAFKENWKGELPSVIMGGGGTPILDLQGMMKQRAARSRED